jgi:hypothetical protein
LIDRTGEAAVGAMTGGGGGEVGAPVTSGGRGSAGAVAEVAGAVAEVAGGGAPGLACARAIELEASGAASATDKSK